MININQKILFQDAVSELSKLTPEGIAALLYSRGIVGIPSLPSRCAIAEYLKAVTGASQITVSALYIGAVFPGEEREYLIANRPMIQVFMARFDDGEYPYLVRNFMDNKIVITQVPVAKPEEKTILKGYEPSVTMTVSDIYSELKLVSELKTSQQLNEQFAELVNA